ncbi:MAG: YidC/Oxa1 family membrane protein insertase [Chitinophagales bacterium]
MNLLRQWLVALLHLLFSWTHNYGLAIIALTVLVRLILYPLTASQMKASAQLSKLQPKMKEIQEKYKDNPEEQQRRLMALYKESGVNPFGGCLPLLVQFPVLIALFNALNKFPYRGVPLFLGINLAEPASQMFYALPILTAVTTYYQMTMTQVDPSQKAMMAFMPLLIGYVSIRFPAGLALYWVVGNLLAIAQQYLMNRKLASKERSGQ